MLSLFSSAVLTNTRYVNQYFTESKCLSYWDPRQWLVPVHYTMFAATEDCNMHPAKPSGSGLARGVGKDEMVELWP